MNAMSPDPAALLAVLYNETPIATKTDRSDVLGQRLRAIEDVLLTMPTDDPGALRVQSKTLKTLATDFQVEPTTTAVMILAAAYAERLADIQEGSK